MAPDGDSRLLRGGAPAAASHRSIGEVLALLKDEFPDITISKIRFLESQGLLDPERTPSGYRRFYDRDVERLRWILLQQRENFLPLKVIKDRLADGAEPVVEPPGEDAPSGPTVDIREEATVSPAPPPVDDHAPSPRVLPDPALFSRADGERSAFSRAGLSTSVSFTAEELSMASGLSLSDISELERFDLIEHRTLGATEVYGDEALLVARAAARLRAHGVEPRHLRMYKVAADREAGVYEQVVLPVMRRRDPESARRALEVIEELARLGESMHAAMLRRALKDFI